MARIVSFVLCDSVTNITANPERNIPALVAPQIALRPQFIPGNFSFGVAVGIADINLHIENRMRFTIVNSIGNIVHDSGENVLPPYLGEDTLPSMYQGFMVNMDIRNMTVDCEGEYKFVLYINNDCVGSMGFPVFKRV